MAVYDPMNSNYATEVLSSIGEKLYLSPELADVDFVFGVNGDCERVPAHKLLLMAASDVFASMFNGSWKESKEVEIGKIFGCKTSADAFKEFLQFFYFGQVKLTMEHVAVVMNLAEMYNVRGCMAVCSKFLKNNLNDENACRSYGLATLLNQYDLKEACETVIGLNTDAVLKTAGFLSCDRKVLAEILKLDWLSCTEVELFEACMLWVKTIAQNDDLTKELVQTHLGDSFYDIRFGLMTFAEFAALMPKYGQFFVGNECIEIIQIIADKEFQPTMFNGSREKRLDSFPCELKNEVDCNRCLSRNFLTHPYFIQTLEITKFSTNEPLLLTGFSYDFIKLHRDDHYVDCEDVPTEITMVEMSGLNDSKEEVVKYNGEAILSSSSYDDVELSPPILVRPGFLYEIRMKQNPPENCAIATPLKREIQEKDGITIQFHDDPLIPDDDSVTGLIYDLNLHQI